MGGEILLSNHDEKEILEGDGNPFEVLEEKVRSLLKKMEELRDERDELVTALDTEKKKILQLGKKLELLSQDREKVKTRIDQLLHRLKGLGM
jgi:chromosome segregation ATPase